MLSVYVSSFHTRVPYNKRLNGRVPHYRHRISIEDFNLADNQLSGFIPPEIQEFLSLTNLTLSGNFLSGPIPIELGLVVSLGKFSKRYKYQVSNFVCALYSHFKANYRGASYRR